MPLNHPVKVAVCGVGRWGSNLTRILANLPGCELVGACDPDARRLRSLPRTAVPLVLAKEPADLVARAHPEALVVSTPAGTHAKVVGMALAAGVDVLVEKPLTTTSRDGAALVKLAARTRRILMVGHIFRYNPAMTALDRMVKSGSLGALRYFYSVRTNLGPIRQDVDVLWDLAPHDISMMLQLTGETPVEVSATGQSYLRQGIADVAFATLRFRKHKALGHLQVSWLDPHKVRRLTVIGSRKMALFDDVNQQEPLRLFDRGVQNEQGKDWRDFGHFQMMLRDGDILIPRVAMEEPLKAECAHFLECVRHRRRPLTDGPHGLAVVRVLEALSTSLKGNGRPVRPRG